MAGESGWGVGALSIAASLQLMEDTLQLALARADLAEKRLERIREELERWNAEAGPGSAWENVLGKQCVTVEFVLDKLLPIATGDADGEG